MAELEDASVDCCITSPPYWGLRDYHLEPLVWEDGWKGSLGLEPSFELYLEHLISIFDEVKRVLKPTGTCFVNMGDTYASGKGTCFNPGGGSLSLEGHAHLKEHGAYPLNRLNKSDLESLGLKPKSLCLIPYRFAIAMIEHRWVLRNVLIWHKPNCMPSSARDRYTVDFEPVFFFTKSQKYWFEQQFETLKTTPHTPGNKNRVPMTHHFDEPNRVWGNEQGRNTRCVWTIPTQPFSGAHFAVFPEALVDPMIKAGCPDTGIVLDPFMGSGTVLLVAAKLGRRSIGYDLSQAYCRLAVERNKQGVL